MTTRKTRRPPAKASKAVKDAADRAEARAKGKAPPKRKKPAKPIDPPIIPAALIAEAVKKMDPKCKYKPEFVKIAREACERGATDMEVAAKLGISRATLFRWKIDYPEFCEALVVGKEIADDRVERSAYELACGYELEVEKLFSYQGTIVRGTTTEHVKADRAAIEMWLGSRRSSKWRQVHKHEHTGKDGGPIELTSASDIAKARLVAFALGQALLAQQSGKVIEGSE